MAFPLWTFLVATLGLIWLIRRRLDQNKKEKLEKLGLKELPGPPGIPLFGNLLQLRGQANKQFCKWAEEYGDIFKLKLANMNTVIVSDPKFCKELFSENVFSGRFLPSDFTMYVDTPHINGIVGSEGELWEVHRRFFLRQLRDFGFGKSTMEALIMDEVNEVIGKYKEKQGTPVSKIRETLKLAVVNSLWRIVSSQRFEQDDPNLGKLANEMVDKVFEVFNTGALLMFMPWLKHIIPDQSGYTDLRCAFETARAFLEKTVAEKKKAFKESDQNDFIDVYLAEVKKNENDPKSTFYGRAGERQLVNILSNVFFAGSDTTATSLSWSILYLCKFPDKQKKLQKEITEITGDSRQVSVNDRPNMPYTQATLEEILRCSSIVPDGVQHRALADKEFRGYLIEKNTIIQPNLYYIHHSKKIWGDPENFRPERFLSPDGKKLMKSENVQAFQVGKRQCVGESLARDSLFLYITNMFQQFDMKFNPNEPEPTIDGQMTFMRTTGHYSVIITDRLKK